MAPAQNTTLEERMIALEQRLAGVEDMARGAEQRSRDAQRIAQGIADEHIAWRAQHVALHTREAEEHAALHARERAEVDASIDERHKAAMSAVGDAYELMGSAASDLGGKAQVLDQHAKDLTAQGQRIEEQGARIETGAKKINAQAWVHSRMGLLVVVGASIGGGLFQSFLYWLTHR